MSWESFIQVMILIPYTAFWVATAYGSMTRSLKASKRE